MLGFGSVAQPGVSKSVPAILSLVLTTSASRGMRCSAAACRPCRSQRHRRTQEPADIERKNRQRGLRGIHAGKTDGRNGGHRRYHMTVFSANVSPPLAHPFNSTTRWRIRPGKAPDLVRDRSRQRGRSATDACEVLRSPGPGHDQAEHAAISLLRPFGGHRRPSRRTSTSTHSQLAWSSIHCCR